jgi:hypothetical protein
MKNEAQGAMLVQQSTSTAAGNTQPARPWFPFEWTSFNVRYAPFATKFCAMQRTAGLCRYCCKSPFVLVIKITFGCTRDLCVKMWGTISREEKLAGDLVNAIEVISTAGRRPNFSTPRKLAHDSLGLLQQYLPQGDLSRCSNLKPELLNNFTGAQQDRRGQLDAG